MVGRITEILKQWEERDRGPNGPSNRGEMVEIDGVHYLKILTNAEVEAMEKDAILPAEEDEFDIMKQRIFRPDDICQLLSVSRSTFDRWVKSEYFPKPDYRIGGPIWKETTFKAFLSKCVEAASKY